MQLRSLLLRLPKRLIDRSNNSLSSTSTTYMVSSLMDNKNTHSVSKIASMRYSTDFNFRNYLITSVKRKRSNLCRRRMGSFTGFDPITGNVSELNEMFEDVTHSSSDSISMKKLRFENQFRMLGEQQAVIELNSILVFWYKSLPPRSFIPTTKPYSVQEMFDWVESMRPHIHPNVSTYQTLLDAFLKRSEKMETAELLLNRMTEVLLEKVREGTEPLPVPEITDSVEITSVLYSYHKIMTIYAKDDNALAAERLLRKLEEISHENQLPLLAHETYAIVISGWAKHGKPREAEYVLYSMLNQKDKTLAQCNIKVLPDKRLFDSCLNAWMLYPTKNSGQRAELLVLKMNELSESGYDTKPNYKSYSKIVHAWVNSKHEHSLSRVDTILETIERMDWSSEADNPYSTDTIAETYLAAMKVCSFQDRNKAAVKKCIDYFSRLDTVLGIKNVDYEKLQLMYAALIYTWAQSALPETEERVQELYLELDALHKKRFAEKEVSTDIDSTTTTKDSDPYLSINVYRALLHAFSRTGSGHHAEIVLRRMMQEYLDVMDKSKDLSSSRKVDTKCFNCVLLAWSKSSAPDAGYQAEKLFRQMYQSQTSKHMNVRMDVVSYNAVLAAMAGTTDVEVARRGDLYFRQMLESTDPLCRATTITYTKAIALWSNIGTREGLNRADELLMEMKTSNNSIIKPTKQTYRAYLELLIKCKFLPPDEYDSRIKETKRLINKPNSK